MVKQDLENLRNKVIDPYVTKNLYHILNSYEEEQLNFMLSQTGIRLNESIFLFRYEGIGYKCTSRQQTDAATCVLIERYLNKKGEIKILD